MDTVNEQAAPVANKKPAVWHLVMADMAARDAIGREKYGTPLQPHNGRNPLIDAYQESLDQTVYLRQAIEEQEAGAVVTAIPNREAMAAELRRLRDREQELLECNTLLVLDNRRLREELAALPKEGRL
jgi:hypothetical protein